MSINDYIEFCKTYCLFAIKSLLNGELVLQPNKNTVFLCIQRELFFSVGSKVWCFIIANICIVFAFPLKIFENRQQGHYSCLSVHWSNFTNNAATWLCPQWSFMSHSASQDHVSFLMRKCGFCSQPLGTFSITWE